MIKILVTGCAGFIGSHLTETLLNQGFKVYGIDNLSNGKLSNISFFNKNTNFIFLEYDINEIDKFNKVLDEVDVIYHLAALADIVPSIQNPESYFNSNVNGTFNLIRNCENKKVKKLSMPPLHLVMEFQTNIQHLRIVLYYLNILMLLQKGLEKK